MEARKMKTTAVKKCVWIPRMTAALACCAAVFLAVWLPFSLADKGPKPPTSRYCISSELSNETLEVNLHDYSMQSNMDCLYLDWYENAFVTTLRYYITGYNDNTVYIHEYMMDLETGDEINYYITDNYTNVDVLLEYKEACINEKEKFNIKINYKYSNMDFMGYFIHADYTYYINIPMPSSEDILFQVVEQMLATAQK